MIDFQKLDISKKAEYEKYIRSSGERCCIYSFANLFLWGRQRCAIVEDHLVLFSQFNRKSVYPFPVGWGDKKAVLDAIIQDARERGIPCRITGMNDADRQILEELYPGQFRIHCDRGGADYVYDINDLADLKGRKFQKKRNHLNKFRSLFPDHRVEPLSRENAGAVKQLLEQWYAEHLAADPEADYHMERAALEKALKHFEALGMEGLVLYDADRVLAFTMGSFLSEETCDVHFEKALDAEGAYTAINQAFAAYLREKHPRLKFLNREEDMGLEGLRKAKLSYNPHHMVEKCWACLLEDGDDY